MYAVVVTGGKQYRVTKGDVIHVEQLDAAAGSSLTLNNVLLIGSDAGIVTGEDLRDAHVCVDVQSHGRADKIRIIKFRRRKHHMKRQGHRQAYTELLVTAINGSSHSS